MKILFSGFRDKNHSSAGGYDKIVNLPGSYYVSDHDVPLGSIPVGQRGKSINLFLLDLLTRCLRFKYDIIHIFYGDNIIFPYLKLKRHKIVATIHLDISKRKRFPSLYVKALQNLDGVIVLSSEQVKLLKREYNINATFIPHGFSKPQFNICKIEIDTLNPINIFFSGVNYRDKTTLIKSVKYVKDKDLNIVFHIVGQKDDALLQKLRQYNNVVCYPRLSDDEYFTLLSSCDYNFLPLTFATANNALLEAQFLGVKSILPNIDGISDYAAPSPMNIFYNSLLELFSYLEILQKQEKQENLMKFSERFLWKNIYDELNIFYSKL